MALRWIERRTLPFGFLAGQGSRRRVRAPSLLAAAMLLLAVRTDGSARGETSWEYSPYSIRVWVALASAPELTEQLEKDIFRTVAEQAEATAGATWDASVCAPPARLRTDMTTDLGAVAVEDVAAADPKALASDKLYLVSVSADAECCRIRARELDCRTRSWGVFQQRQVWQPGLLASEVFRAVVAAFRPLARIDDVKGKMVLARIRAGGLVVNNQSPNLVGAGAVLQPVTRRNDRLGQARSGGIQTVPWTFLQVVSRSGSAIQCEVHSGMRNPIRGRSNPRTERLALAVRAVQDSTLLRLQSRDEPPQALAGYELYAKDALATPPSAPKQTASAEADEPMQCIGCTDWRGVLKVPRSDRLLRILYVKNGGQVLARLPLVPGLDEHQTASLPNDDMRLEAEAFIRGFQTTIMDLVAHRAALAARIRRRISKGEADEARKLVQQFRSLSSPSELSRLLNEQRQRLRSPDSRLQAKIDQLFAETETLMSKYLDPSEANRLESELRAKGG